MTTESQSTLVLLATREEGRVERCSKELRDVPLYKTMVCQFVQSETDLMTGKTMMIPRTALSAGEKPRQRHLKLRYRLDSKKLIMIVPPANILYDHLL